MEHEYSNTYNLTSQLLPNGLAVSLSYAFFLVCRTYTNNLTSKLLPKPRPTPRGQGPLLLEAERDKTLKWLLF